MSGGYEGIYLTLEAANILATFGLGFGLYWITGKASQIDDLGKKLDTSEERAHALTEKLIDERIRSWSHTLGGEMQNLVLRVKDMNDRLRDGEDDFEKLGNRDQKLELALTNKIDELKDWMRETGASKDDLRRHETSTTQKFDRIDAALGAFGRELSALGERTARVKQ